MPYPYTLDYTPKRHPEGPWSHEPNFADWEAHGFACAITRHSKYGHLCGYVGLTKVHPYYGVEAGCNLMKRSDKPTSRFLQGVGYVEETFEPVIKPTAHYGLDYSSAFGDLWWLGFACNHCDDLQPSDMRPRGGGWGNGEAKIPDWVKDRTYRTWSDVVVMVNTLAHDLSEIRA